MTVIMWLWYAVTIFTLLGITDVSYLFQGHYRRIGGRHPEESARKKTNAIFSKLGFANQLSITLEDFHSTIGSSPNPHDEDLHFVCCTEVALLAIHNYIFRLHNTFSNEDRLEGADASQQTETVPAMMKSTHIDIEADEGEGSCDQQRSTPNEGADETHLARLPDKEVDSPAKLVSATSFTTLAEVHDIPDEASLN